MKLHVLHPLMILIAIMAFSATGAYAQQPDENSLIERLGLTSAQQTQIRDLREKFRAETEQIRKDIRKLVDEEKQLKKAPSPDVAALREVLKKRADKEIELSLALTRFNEQIEAILTADQKRMLQKIRAEQRKP